MKKTIHSIMAGVGVLLTQSALGATPTQPNILIILADDMGYSDIGCFGGEINTPNINRLAANGMRFTNMYNMAKSFPSRASLLTGAYYQRTNADFENTATLGEVLRPAGYHTFWAGKQHAKFNPTTRGFDRYYGMIGGCENHFNPGFDAAEGQDKPAHKVAGNHWDIDEKNVPENGNYVPKDPKFYDTDAFTTHAISWLDEYKKDNKPFLLYMAYTAPHWPLQAWPEDIAKYKGVYDGGYEGIRQARYKRQVEMGLIDPKTAPLPPMEIGETKGKWENLSEKERKQEAKRMEIYAGMVDRLDQNIGRLIKHLEEQGKLDNTLILFMSDNGACATDPQPDYVDNQAVMGSVASYPSYGQNWATVSNTPMRKWKTTSHEGGVSTPLIAHWPTGMKAQKEWNHSPIHLIDIMPTVMAVSGAKLPGESKQTNIKPFDGVSLLPAFKGKSVEHKNPLFFQYAKSAAINDGEWKLVRLGNNWELYNVKNDRTEMNDLSSKYPEKVNAMEGKWLEWWKDCTGKAWDGKVKKDKDE